MLAALRRFWFAEKAPLHLGILRFVVLFSTFLEYSYYRGGLPVVAWPGLRVNMPSWWRPNTILQVTHLGVAPVTVLVALKWAFAIATVLACIGLFTRVSTAVAALAGMYLIGLKNSFGHAHHNDPIAVIALCTLAISYCGDAFSIDSLRRAARAQRGGSEATLVARRAAAGEYRWPIQLLCVVSACAISFAGVSKLRHGGIDWVLSDNLSYLMQEHHYPGINPTPPTTLGIPLSKVGALCTFLAAGTLLLELSFPLALFWPLARNVLVPSMFLDLMGFRLVLGPFFQTLMVLMVIAWFDWGAFATRIAASRGGPIRGRFLFDGDCGVCQRTVAVLRRLSIMRRVAFVDARNEWDAVAEPSLEQSQCLAEIHYLQDGKVYRGFKAYRALAWRLPLFWPMLPILYVPGVSIIGQAVYQLVAHSRDTTTCAVPPQ